MKYSQEDLCLVRRSINFSAWHEDRESGANGGDNKASLFETSAIIIKEYSEYSTIQGTSFPRYSPSFWLNSTIKSHF